jgi:Domain of unknown function (DUF4136)
MNMPVKHCAHLLILSLVLLGACAGRISTDVVSFHEDALPKGETIRVVPANQDLQDNLEFEHYAQMIRAELKKIGYTPVSGDSPAVLLAEIDYSVSDSDTIVRSRPGSFARYHFHYGHYHDPFFYGLHSEWEPEVYSFTVFHRDVRLTIRRADAPTTHIYEARVHSVGRERDISRVMPYLITAMFRNYPGENGVTKIVTIEKDR